MLCKPGHFEPENEAHVAEVVSAIADWPEATVTFHAPFHTADLGSADPHIWEPDLRHVIQSLQVASRFRAESATIHVRGHGARTDWDDSNRVAFLRALETLVPVAADCKMTLSVENTPPRRFAGEPENLLGLLNGYPTNQLGVCFDTGHANFDGDVLRIGSVLASRTFVMHIHDNHAVGKDEHNIPGEGNIPWPTLVESLLKNGYRGRNVIEYVERDVENNTLDRLRIKLKVIGESILQSGLHNLAGSKR